VIYLKHVEQQRAVKKEEVSVKQFGAPAIMTPLRDLAINEGEKIHFEAKISPIGDPSMKVEWYLNGAPIAASEWLFS
jgi:titin